MTCPACDGETVTLAVPEDLREYATTATDGGDAGPSTVAVCTNCLRVHDATDEPTGDAGAVSDALPADDEAAVALLLAAALLDSVASNRQAVEALVARVERAGADPVLAFERLGSDPDLEPAVALPRRFRQFEQLRD